MQTVATLLRLGTYHVRSAECCCSSWLDVKVFVAKVVGATSSDGFVVILCVYGMPSVLWCCWLGGRKGIWSVKNWVARYWHGYLSRARCKWFAYGPADATATSSSVAPVKSIMVYLCGSGFPRLSWKKAVKWMLCSSYVFMMMWPELFQYKKQVSSWQYHQFIVRIHLRPYTTALMLWKPLFLSGNRWFAV